MVSLFPAYMQDALLRAMQLCVFKFSEWQDKMEDEGEGEGGVEIPEVMELAKDTLTSVVDRMGRSELDDFELDRSSDFSMGSSVGQRNRVLAELLMRIYEVCACACTCACACACTCACACACACACTCACACACACEFSLLDSRH